MDKGFGDIFDKEGSEKRNSNSEWLPTKCRITKPPPPKPATNPLQFVKVTPSNLFQKAHEHIKKVDEIKTQKPGIKEDAEEWQQNLDNWKSSRRKRQEHIIERVVEVKKLEQEGFDKNRRKSKTFSEMMEERNKRGHRLNIPIYDDDSNDLSDYGIGSSSSKTNSVKDVDTDDSTSCLDDRDPGISTSDSRSGKDASSASNQSQSEDEMLSSTNHIINKDNNSKPITVNKLDDYFSISKNVLNKPSKVDRMVKQEEYAPEDYTFQKAIEDYRSKILPKLNEPIQSLTRVEACKPPTSYQAKKATEVTYFDYCSKRMPEDFVSSLSIKERLQNLKECADTQVKKIENNSHGNSVKNIIKTFAKQEDNEKKNNSCETFKSTNSTTKHSKSPDTSDSVFNVTKSLELDECVGNKSVNGSESPEVEDYTHKMCDFNYDLGSYSPKSHSPLSILSECCEHTTAPLSGSSTELLGMSSDRADSGVHTAEASCAVSQADESVEYTDMLSSTIPNCIEKLQKERERELTQQVESKLNSQFRQSEDLDENPVTSHNLKDYVTNYQVLIQSTQIFLDNVKETASNDWFAYHETLKKENIWRNNNIISINSVENDQNVDELKTEPAVYENVDLKNCSGYLDDFFITANFPLAPPKTKEPPKEKPPPPPPLLEEDNKLKHPNIKRLSSTKRIKKEMHIKRSSFLGLDEPTDDILDPVIPIDTPPDVNTFLQKESQLEKSLYKKYQDSRELYSSEVESQDSGLESERGRLSSDTWCSSITESTISTHGRQDSEQTNNSVTSDEDEIAKKEREIIALVEKEEKSKDMDQCSNFINSGLACCNTVLNNKKIEHFNLSYFPKHNLNYSTPLTREYSEPLKNDHKVQTECIEVEKKKVPIFRENNEKLLSKNRYSLENICDASDTFLGYYENVSCRKSMPELPNNIHSNIYKPQHLTTNSSYYKQKSSIDAHRKSMPDIQQAFLKSVDIHDLHKELWLPLEHRKSLPELQKATNASYIASNRKPVIQAKPLISLIKEQHDRDKLLMATSFTADLPQYHNLKSGELSTRPGLNALSAIPKHCHVSNDNWIQPKMNVDSKPNYSQHWLYQEAEYRRLSEQKTNTERWNFPQTRTEKHIPDSIIQSLTQRFQNLSSNERVCNRRLENSLNQESPSYINRSHMVGHALPIPYPPIAAENIEGKILSVSGKKKCSFCGSELGRGAAMIIESLSLFYHMDCFKCCVCHVKLSDGQMGTDVRVRNQKLHCHNCYTSDDGVKFSCV